MMIAAEGLDHAEQDADRDCSLTVDHRIIEGKKSNLAENFTLSLYTLQRYHKSDKKEKACER